VGSSCSTSFGGSLHQHVADLGLSGDHGRPQSNGGSVEVDVVPGTLLHAALGTARVSTACFHHQSVDRVGQGLVVTARAPDGEVEGLELADAGSWLVAVQWHPELLAASSPPHQGLFDALAAACHDGAPVG
jgi:putative glutamine amidotransferase